jgi:ZIP family zinc transporter
LDFSTLLLGAGAALLATTLGAAGVFTFRRIGKRSHALILSFCAGAMAYTALEMVNEAHASLGHRAAIASLVAGMIAFLAIDKLMPHAHLVLLGVEMPSARRKAALLVGTITLHNIPEGFAIASAFASSSSLGWLVTLPIALQDIPEGLIVAAPVACYGMEPRRCFLWGVLSGIVEFAAAVAGFLFLRVVENATPLALGFSGGVMGSVVLSELLPDALQAENRYLSLAMVTAGLATAYGFAMLIGF